MSKIASRRTRDKLLFILAYGVIAGAVLFGHPFGRAQNAEVAQASITVR